MISIASELKLLYLSYELNIISYVLSLIIISPRHLQQVLVLNKNKILRLRACVCACVAKPAEGLIKRKNGTIFAISKVRIIDASKHQYASDITTACETVEFMTVNLRKMFVNFTSKNQVRSLVSSTTRYFINQCSKIESINI